MLTVDFHHLDLHPGQRLLDLGCGEGRHLIGARFAADVQALGVDLSVDALKTAANRYAETLASFATPGKSDRPDTGIALQQADAGQLPFADATFDRIVCSEVLEHLTDYPAALGEIHRVLKPGGLLAISVPRYWPERLCWWLSRDYHQVDGGHLRIFKTGPLRRELESLGLNCYRRHWAHALHSPYWWLQCLFWKTRDTSALVRAYHRFLVWDLMSQPRLTRILEALLNPLMGKSLVLYFRKPAAANRVGVS